ncbi:MAG: XrtA/PEP-CTERM system histidine kinase PrsK [Novosphingobium sp.]
MDGWAIFSGSTHMIAACASATFAVWLRGRNERFGAAGTPIIAALAICACWALAVVVTGTDSAATSLLEAVRNLACLVVVYCLFVSDGRQKLIKPVRPLLIALAGSEVLQMLMLLVERIDPHGPFGGSPMLGLSMSFRMILAIGGLVLLHNLYSGAGRQARLSLRWPAAALTLLWGYDLNLYTVAYLGHEWPVELAALRGLVLIGTVGLLIPGAAKRSDELYFSPSRAVTFQLASLVGIGLYLAGMVALARWIAFIGGDFARMLEFGILITAVALALLTLPSRRMRGWLKVTLVKHLFRHRYDYRTEWLRFAQTIGRSGENALPLEERAVQAVAQITESPAGLLLVPGEHGDMVLAGRWQWPMPEVPATALDGMAIRFFELTGFVVEMDAVRAGTHSHGEAVIVPQWLVDEGRAWALVPLIHHQRLMGVVVIARPPHPRRLDWEDFDLLRVIGQQLATTLAEHAGQDALAEATRFDEFNRRIAFVMHDIKNLASQLGLLAHNAESHAENPAFRADMLVTLRNSADKLNALIARLSRYNPPQSAPGSREAARVCDVGLVIRQTVQQFANLHPVFVTHDQGGEIHANADALEQALVHLVQNAVDASSEKSPVFINQTNDGLHATIEVIDSGVGMSPEFIRTRLFKPFVSSKQGGFGIGAFEARELIRAMSGRLDVESREGLGTRFVVRLPLATTTDLLSTYAHNNEQKVA